MSVDTIDIEYNVYFDFGVFVSVNTNGIIFVIGDNPRNGYSYIPDFKNIGYRSIRKYGRKLNENRRNELRNPWS